jgi:metal-responsive CopG/Arc/MetJ family transcriptional regulator
MNPGAPNLAVRLDAEDIELLEQLRKREKMTRSEIVRRAIRKVAREAGLLAPKQESLF